MVEFLVKIISFIANLVEFMITLYLIGLLIGISLLGICAASYSFFV